MTPHKTCVCQSKDLHTAPYLESRVCFQTSWHLESKTDSRKWHLDCRVGCWWREKQCILDVVEIRAGGRGQGHLRFCMLLLALVVRLGSSRGGLNGDDLTKVMNLFQSERGPRKEMDDREDRPICGRLGVCPYLVSQDSRPTITLSLSLSFASWRWFPWVIKF